MASFYCGDDGPLPKGGASFDSDSSYPSETSCPSLLSVHVGVVMYVSRLSFLSCHATHHTPHT